MNSDRRTANGEQARRSAIEITPAIGFLHGKSQILDTSGSKTLGFDRSLFTGNSSLKFPSCSPITVRRLLNLSPNLYAIRNRRSGILGSIAPVAGERPDLGQLHHPDLPARSEPRPRSGRADRACRQWTTPGLRQQRRAMDLFDGSPAIPEARGKRQARQQDANVGLFLPSSLTSLVGKPGSGTPAAFLKFAGLGGMTVTYST